MTHFSLRRYGAARQGAGRSIELFRAGTAFINARPGERTAMKRLRDVNEAFLVEGYHWMRNALSDDGITADAASLAAAASVVTRITSPGEQSFGSAARLGGISKARFLLCIQTQGANDVLRAVSRLLPMMPGVSTLDAASVVYDLSIGGTASQLAVQNTTVDFFA